MIYSLARFSAGGGSRWRFRSMTTVRIAAVLWVLVGTAAFSEHLNWEQEQSNLSKALLDADSTPSCMELRSKRFISDGFCTSSRPITEVVCAGMCVPAHKLPWYTEYVTTWSRRQTGDADNWQCVHHLVKKKKIRLLCKDGETRSYVIRVVKECRCKKLQLSRRKKKQEPQEAVERND